MTDEEQGVYEALECAKKGIAGAFVRLDPAFMEPFTRAMLIVLDSIDRASVLLQQRARVGEAE